MPISSKSALLSLIIASVCASGAADASEPAFEVTEDRDRCDHYTERRQPFFGATHLHTGLSFDASIRFVEDSSGNNPRGAYQFAKGEKPMILPGSTGIQGIPADLRKPMIDRPLDWGAVTDHSEHFAEMGVCKNYLGRHAGGRRSLECRMINGHGYMPQNNLSNLLGRTLASNAFTQLSMWGLGGVSRMTRTPLCEGKPFECAEAELAVWDEVQSAARDEYDTSSSCSFTTFVAYENTSTPSSTNWHRNVIFRNDRVVERPITSIDMAVRINRSPLVGGLKGTGVAPSYIGDFVPRNDPDVNPVEPGTFVTHPLPQRLWNRLQRECLDNENTTDGDATRCDVLTIPHNTNLGGALGLVPALFFDPFNTEDAELRAKFEPLVEMYQDKGSSECRFDPRFDAGTETRDEFCNFEILDSGSLTSASGVGGGDEGNETPPSEFDSRAYVRNIWKDGMALADAEYDGVNPFKMGVVASSDAHTGVMGWHPENEDWPGHLGIDDAFPVSRPSTIQNSSGGHGVVWAEENSRDAIFEALKRKETYGTSGTRPIVRFFGGWDFPQNMCRKDLVKRGYRDGVPMGGDLPSRPSADAKPRFVVAAWMDDFIGTPLEQIQIIKAWVGRDGKTRERVYRLAGDQGDPNRPERGIYEDTCETKPGGYEQLCETWEDPYFQPGQRALYYVRVIEKPVCRYSTHWCRERIGVDPLEESCQDDLDAMTASKNPLKRLRASRGASCCSTQDSFPYVQPVIQERAWTSPIWYTPEGT
ncbi:MAG: DUF3604 domain-containing protein [bacterium]|nr:DUF3604 domain-containing protein [bacterium]